MSRGRIRPLFKSFPVYATPKWSRQQAFMVLSNRNQIIRDTDDYDVSTPTDSDETANSVSEAAANGTTVGIIASASDLDPYNNTITYSLTDSAGGRFAIGSSTGVVTVADTSLLNYESATSHNITVLATSSDGSTASQTFTINITDYDEFDVSTPVDSNASANTVVDTASNGTTVGITASASDADGSTNTITYSLSDSANGRFAINSSTGVVTVADTSQLDYNTDTSHDITVVATSADSSTASATFTINVTAGSLTLTISTNTSEYNILTAATAAGYDASADETNIIVNINSGITVSASSSYAMRTGALNSNSDLTINNSGDIDGYTGATGSQSGSLSGTGGTGSVGGDAIYWETSTGGSGTYAINNLSCAKVRGGGGGGGGGGGPGARRNYSCGKDCNCTGSPITGTSGSNGSDGGFGAAGSSGSSGNFAGGSSNCITSAVGSGGGGGAAGYAIRKNSRTVTYTDNGTTNGTVG